MSRMGLTIGWTAKSLKKPTLPYTLPDGQHIFAFHLSVRAVKWLSKLYTVARHFQS